MKGYARKLKIYLSVALLHERFSNKVVVVSKQPRYTKVPQSTSILVSTGIFKRTFFFFCVFYIVLFLQPNWSLKGSDPNGTCTPTTGFNDQYEEIIANPPHKMNDYDNAEEPLSTKIQVDDEDEQSDDDAPPKFITAILNFQKSVGKYYRRHKPVIHSVILAILAIGYAGYFGYAMWYNLEGEDSIRLLWITCVIVFFCIVKLVNDTCGEQIYKSCLLPIVTFIEHRFILFKW